MAKRYYNLEKETKVFLKRMDATRGVLPDGAGISRVNDYITKRKGLGLFYGNRDKSSLQVKASLTQRISIPSNSSLVVTPSWEMVAWIYPTSTPGVAEVITKGNNAVGGYEFGFRAIGSSIALQSSTGGTGNKTYAINTWQFFNFGRDQSTSNLFLSRNLDSPSTGLQSTQTFSGNAFVIGNWADASRPADGIIDGVGRWSRVLTTAERTFIYNTDKGVSYLELLAYRPDILVGCVSYWQLNEPSGVRYDWHGTNHMSPINSPLSSPAGKIEKFY